MAGALSDIVIWQADWVVGQLGGQMTRRKNKPQTDSDSSGEQDVGFVAYFCRVSFAHPAVLPPSQPTNSLYQIGLRPSG